MADIRIAHADMLAWLANYDGPLFDSACTDPPYHLTSIVKRFSGEGAKAPKGRSRLSVAADKDLGTVMAPAFKRLSRGFMGKTWDGGDIAQRPETWRAVYDVLKPGAHLVAFAGARTFHRMVVAIEDAGFEIRDGILDLFDADELAQSFMASLSSDQAEAFARLLDAGQFTGMLAWIYGTGFPKSHNQKGEWEGFGTALKPAFEPICLARKPLSEKSVAANLAKHRVGALNIGGCRIDGGTRDARDATAKTTLSQFGAMGGSRASGKTSLGRWPANVIHDGSDEVVGSFSNSNGQQGDLSGHSRDRVSNGIYGDMGAARDFPARNDEGSAARFFYSAKAGPFDRIGTAHATVKPVDLMRWLIRLVTPPGGRVLDPFAGSGTTGIACMAEGFDCQMIELEAEHVTDIRRKLDYLLGKGGLSVIEKHKAKRDREAKDGALDDAGPLFGVA
jgi:site-specific DNA-methyltransferase (adenine-specific)